jgi:hypothetical protein
MQASARSCLKLPYLYGHRHHVDRQFRQPCLVDHSCDSTRSGNARTYGQANASMADDATGLRGVQTYTLEQEEIDPASPSGTGASAPR